MKYLVIIHYRRKGELEYKTMQHGFSDYERAEEYAKDWYDALDFTEISALIYELKKAFN